MQNIDKTLSVNGKEYKVFDISKLNIPGGLKKVPYSIRVLLENVLRKQNGKSVTERDIEKVLQWKSNPGGDIPYHPARVLMQDFTGVPCVVDLAAMRNAIADKGGDPKKINPIIPVNLIIDHSVSIDYWGDEESLDKNVALEYKRNTERYRLLKWATENLDNFHVVPPNSGICHQINFEYLGQVVRADNQNGSETLFPDTLVGTDSHTTMINGLGIMGWGVGGIEAESALLGQPYIMPVPEVVGVKLTGTLNKGVTASDLVLTLVEMLRKHGVVGKFVEYFGPGMVELPLPDRATIANMGPEYGATMGFFPVDEKTIDFLKMTGREEAAVRTEAYLKATGMFFDAAETPDYNAVLELDLSTVKPSVAGPYRPNQRIDLENLPKVYREEAAKHKKSEGPYTVELNGKNVDVPNGAIAIAAITSCTNTSNPHVMIGAGLLAKNAAEKGMKIPEWVKTSLAPGSRVVTDYLDRAEVTGPLKSLGFNIAAFGCTTCIGNSGPIAESLSETVDNEGLLITSVSSGNRNFEARIHQKTRYNFLASPMYVVAYALAGTVNIDIQNDPIGKDSKGNDVYLKDIWPDHKEIDDTVAKAVYSDDYVARYSSVTEGDLNWKSLKAPKSTLFEWAPESTYIRKPEFFDIPDEMGDEIENARLLGIFGDTVTTDHISPAGTIPPDYPAGKYLLGKGVQREDFNSYGSRRGNHEVMIRGTFANIRLKNFLCPDEVGGMTKVFPSGEVSFIYDAAEKYADENTPLIIISGKEYGTGSSRDWAAKGTRLQGVKLVIAVSFERIHRSNLVGMGVIPSTFAENESAETLGIKGDETFTIKGLKHLSTMSTLEVEAKSPDGSKKNFSVTAQIFSDVEVEFIRTGGVLPYVLTQM